MADPPGSISFLAEPLFIVLAVPWECVLVFDLIVMALTIGKTHCSWKALRPANLPLSAQIPGIMLRDGAGRTIRSSEITNVLILVGAMYFL